MNIGLKIIVLHLLVSPFVISVQHELGEGSASGVVVVEYLLKKLLAEINPIENLIIAPSAIQNLFNELLETNELSNSKYSNSNGSSISISSSNNNNNSEQHEIGFTAKQPSNNHTMEHATQHPIRVTNKLQNAEIRNRHKIVSNIQNEKSEFAATMHTAANGKPTTSIQLINDVTLNARWAFNFQKRDTHKRLFHTTQQQHTYLDAMRKDDIFHYALLEHLNATALELSLYPQDYKILFLLPLAKNGLVPLAHHLSENFHLVEDIAVRQYLRPRLVRVLLPKFRLSTKFDLNNVLKDLNMSVVSSAGKSLWHHAHININERGIGKLNRTTVLFWNAFSSFRTSPAIFEINHPFLFFIRNSKGIQFFGYLSKLN